ncbi:hypothetical protein K9N68_08090 [Kovacikia minuta CCNUW1]|uniref:hypothetical protein n=1 Tax=Kovacikia minuta TaxID=2931930 RepID=UPI001CCF20D9|nr:hypothetical protein [Kovacikia minuta]UBF27851.1 hypothetical protein K9N68_08090 [Kovacikia minuta CCNUW1]
MSFRFGKTIALAIAFLLTQNYVARADDPLENNPQPYRCEDSVVTKVGTYFENDPSSGFYAVFQSKLGVEQFPDTRAAVVDRAAGTDSVLAQQKVGDKVQVCLIGSPAKDQYCDPEKDSRGRFFRIYSYRLKAAYTGTNANHLCGGA